MTDLFMVTTGEGARAFDAGNQGMSETDAAASARERNDRALSMGLTVRYVVAPFVPTVKG